MVSPAWLLIAALVPAHTTEAPRPSQGAEKETGQAIIVTGERTRRTLRETASSVAVFESTDIEATGANGLDQLLSSVPNVQLGNGSQGPAIRGQDTTGPLYALPAFLGGNRPRTTVVVDGRPATYNEFVFGPAPVWDVKRVEIFRSPQTTTQGQNSIAGAIFVYSEDPTFEPEARVRLIGGDYRTGEASFAASAPLSRHVAARLAGDLRYNRTTSRITDVMAGADPNHEAYGMLRAKLLVLPGGDDGRLLVTSCSLAFARAANCRGQRTVSGARRYCAELRHIPRQVGLDLRRLPAAAWRKNYCEPAVDRRRHQRAPLRVSRLR